MQNVEQTKENEPVLQFTYRNYKGNVAARNVVHPEVVWGVSDWYNDGQPTWLLMAFDLDKQATRGFALDHILSFESIPF